MKGSTSRCVQIRIDGACRGGYASDAGKGCLAPRDQPGPEEKGQPGNGFPGFLDPELVGFFGWAEVARALPDWVAIGLSGVKRRIAALAGRGLLGTEGEGTASVRITN
jgi:hypothetical protein